MSKLWSSQLTDLALAGAVTVALPLVAFLLWPVIAARLAPAPQGPILIYEVDPNASPSGATVDPNQVADAVRRCVNPGAERLADVRKLDNGRIEVALIRPDEADTQRVERLLAHTATLELRVLANDRHDKALIDRALADPSKRQVLGKQGELLAWWAPVRAGAEKNLADYSDIARRTKTSGKRAATEVLIVKDECNLNGAHLLRAEAGDDSRGQPALVLLFDNRGGRLFRQLTSSHPPDKAANLNYKLGIILNGELLSAPLIVSTVYNFATIPALSPDRKSRNW
jgi:preprotein translocase subunit SecD